MAIERTFSIIKPDATERNLTGAINALIEKAGLRIVAQKRIRMTREQAETFYAVHKARPFFGELVDFMISGPVVVQVLEGEDAVLEASRRDGRDRSFQGGRRHHPQAARQVDRRELGAWFGRRRDRGDRNRAVFLGQRNRRLIDTDLAHSAVETCSDGRRVQQGRAVNGLLQVVDPANVGAFLTQFQADLQSRRSGSRSARSSGSTCCCPATTRW